MRTTATAAIKTAYPPRRRRLDRSRRNGMEFLPLLFLLRSLSFATRRTGQLVVVVVLDADPRRRTLPWAAMPHTRQRSLRLRVRGRRCGSARSTEPSGAPTGRQRDPVELQAVAVGSKGGVVRPSSEPTRRTEAGAGGLRLGRAARSEAEMVGRVVPLEGGPALSAATEEPAGEVDAVALEAGRVGGEGCAAAGTTCRRGRAVRPRGIGGPAAARSEEESETSQDRRHLRPLQTPFHRAVRSGGTWIGGFVDGTQELQHTGTVRTEALETLFRSCEFHNGQFP